MDLNFSLFRNLLVSVFKLSDNCTQQIESVRQVLDVIFTLAADLNKFLKHLGVSQHAKAVIILAKIKQNSISVQCFFEIVFVFGGKRVKKAHNNLATLLGQNFLHFLLLG